jgi:hypothetical protein
MKTKNDFHFAAVEIFLKELSKNKSDWKIFLLFCKERDLPTALISTSLAFWVKKQC